MTLINGQLNQQLQQQSMQRATYCGLPATECHKIDTELVSRIITNLKRGKAIDIDGLRERES